MKNIIKTASEIISDYETELLYSKELVNKGKILLDIIDDLGLKLVEKTKKLPEEITNDDLLNKNYNSADNRTVGYLVDFINENKISRDSLIFTQRVEDSYYETGGWGVRRKKGEDYFYVSEFNKDLKNGEFEKGKDFIPYTEEDLEQFKEQYSLIWSPVQYKGDNNLYLDLHY